MTGAKNTPRTEANPGGRELVTSASSVRPSYPAEQHLRDRDAWTADALDAVAMLAQAGAVFTAEDVADFVTDPPHPNQWGALMRRAWLDGLIRPVGYVRSRKTSRHAGVIRLWTGRAEEVAA